MCGTWKHWVVWMAAMAVALGVGVAYGGFSLVEDFECLSPGSISGQGLWRGAASSIVTVDPEDSGNQVLAVTTDSVVVSRPMRVEQGERRMMFLRFRVGSLQMCSFGLSHLSRPSEFSDFGPELGLSNSSLDFRIRNDGMYNDLTTLDPNTWYNVWLQVDNEADTTQVWLHATVGASANAVADQLANEGEETVFSFRTSGSSDLVSFFVKTGGGSSSQNSGPLYIDDIYLETTSALNLEHPWTLHCPDGDINGDCVVDFGDLATMAGAWLSEGAELGPDIGPWPCGDGRVNLVDFAVLRGFLSLP